MRRFVSLLLFWTLVLSACSPIFAAPQPAPASQTPLGVPTTVTPDPIVTVDTPPPEPQNCGYQWAYGDLPELSSSFQQSIQQLQSEAQASAFAFGENCVNPDGTIAGFTPMETDFNVTLHVDDLANEAVLGRWIVQVMQVIEQVPADQIAGPRPGKVSIVFQSSTAQSVTNFYIDQYQALDAGLNHEEIYHALQTPQ